MCTHEMDHRFVYTRALHILLLVLLSSKCILASSSGVRNDDQCNDVAVSKAPKNVSCLALTDDTECSLGEGALVKWVITRNHEDWSYSLFNGTRTVLGNPTLGVTSGIINNGRTSVDPNSQELVISTVLDVFVNTNLSCTVVLPNGTECGSDLYMLTIADLDLLKPPIIIHESVDVATLELNGVPTINPTIGHTLTVCYRGDIVVDFKHIDQVQLEWSWRGESTSVPQATIDPRSVATEGCGLNEPFTCNCLTKNFLGLRAVVESNQHFNGSRLRSYKILVHNRPQFPKIEECVTVPNGFISVVVLDDVSLSDKRQMNFDIRLTQSARCGSKCNRFSFAVQPEYIQVRTRFSSNHPFSSTVQSFSEHTNAIFVCEATTSGNTTLSWRRTSPINSLAQNVTQIDSQLPPTDLESASRLCSEYSEGEPALLSIVTAKRFFPSDKGALILTQRVALVFCNFVSNQSGSFECRPPDLDTSRTGVSVTVRVSHPGNTERIVIAVVCVLVVLVVVTAASLVIACYKYRLARKSPLWMWRTEPNSPLIRVDVTNPQFETHESVEGTVGGEDVYEFPRKQLQLGHVLGEGQFGVVHQAVAEGICSFDKSRTVVAVKTVKQNARPSDIIDLRTELETMKKMEPHPNIINFLGVCSKPENEPLYILMEFAMFGSLKDYLKSVRTAKPRPHPPPPNPTYSQYLCPYHQQHVLKYADSHYYGNQQAQSGNGDVQVSSVKTTPVHSPNSNSHLTPSPAHSVNPSVESESVDPTVLAHISRLMRLLSSDYYYVGHSGTIPTIEINSPSPEPPEVDHTLFAAQASVPLHSKEESPYSFDRLSSKCVYRAYPQSASYRTYVKDSLSPDHYYNTAYSHLEPREGVNDSSNPTLLPNPPSYVNIPKSCDCQTVSDTTDSHSCDSHVTSVFADYQTKYHRRKSSLSNYYYNGANCIYCAQLNRSGSYRNLDIPTGDGPSSSEGGAKGGAVRSDGGGAGDGVKTGGDSDMGELSYFEVLDFAHQIANGMEHLENMKCVHRDLAARNVLIAEGFLLKIGDFGLARDLDEKDYYRKISPGRIPARWMALESLEERKHTSKSDVWSFGVLLWEILTYGEFPYGKSTFASSIESLTRYLKQGHRLPQPVICSTELYDLLKMCWEEDPEKRPSFSHLVTFFNNLMSASKEYLNLTVSEACHEPRAGHLEANVMAGIGCKTGRNFKPQISETSLDFKPPRSDKANSCPCVPDIQYVSRYLKGSLPVLDSATPDVHKQNGNFLTPQPAFKWGSCTNFDSAGYLKLRASSRLLLDDVGTPVANGSRRGSEPCHIGCQSTSTGNENGPPASGYTENEGGPPTSGYDHLEQWVAAKKGPESTGAGMNHLLSSSHTNGRFLIKEQVSPRVKQVSEGCTETEV